MSLCFKYIVNWFRNIRNVKKNKKDIYEVQYKHNGKYYKFPLLIKRGPKPVILLALDENGNDITDEINMYYGPYGNFNGLQLTPNNIGYKKITITFDEDNIKTFIENEVILLN